MPTAAAITGGIETLEGGLDIQAYFQIEQKFLFKCTCLDQQWGHSQLAQLFSIVHSLDCPPLQFRDEPHGYCPEPNHI